MTSRHACPGFVLDNSLTIRRPPASLRSCGTASDRSFSCRHLVRAEVTHASNAALHHRRHRSARARGVQPVPQPDEAGAGRAGEHPRRERQRTLARDAHVPVESRRRGPDDRADLDDARAATPDNTNVALVLANASPGGMHPWQLHRGQCGTDDGVFGSASDYKTLKVDEQGRASGSATVPIVDAERRPATS